MIVILEVACGSGLALELAGIGGLQVDVLAPKLEVGNLCPAVLGVDRVRIGSSSRWVEGEL